MVNLLGIWEPTGAPPWDPPAKRPSLWPVWVASLLLFGGSVVGTGVLLATRGGAGDAIAFVTSLQGLLTSAALSSTWILIVSVGGAALSPTPFRTRLGLLAPRLPWPGWVLAALGALALSQAAEAILILTGVGRGGVLSHLLATLSKARGIDLALAVMLIGVLAGLAEEFFFRGFAQQRLVERVGPFWGVLMAAALFAVAHFDPQHSGFAFAFGIYLGFLAWASGGIWPAVAAHAINNSVSVLSTALGLDAGEASSGLHWLTLAVSLPVLALAVRWFALLATRRERPARADA